MSNDYYKQKVIFNLKLMHMHLSVLSLWLLKGAEEHKKFLILATL